MLSPPHTETIQRPYLSRTGGMYREIYLTLHNLSLCQMPALLDAYRIVSVVEVITTGGTILRLEFVLLCLATLCHRYYLPSGGFGLAAVSRLISFTA